MTDRTDDEVLAAVLSAYQLRARILFNPQYCGRFVDDEEPAPPGTAWFHLVDRGECDVRIPGRDERVPLRAGDFVMLSRGPAHWLENTTAADAEALTVLLCGEFSFVSGNPLLDALPDVLVVRQADAGVGFLRITELLVAESNFSGFGSSAVMDKLADALFVMTLRHYLGEAQERRGLLAALADPRLRRPLLALHAEPGRNWSVSGLAELAYMSRTVFAERFTRTLGIAPYQYLTQCRMNEALRQLRDPRISVATVSSQLGYGTEAAFRRSFKRVFGYGPGRVRRGDDDAVVPAQAGSDASGVCEGVIGGDS